MKSYDILIIILGVVYIFMIGLGAGYIWGTYKINNCKTLSPSQAFKNKECREFYLGN